MPGPFPGMDPYLECPDSWQGFQLSLVVSISGILNRTLPQGFAAHIEERVYDDSVKERLIEVRRIDRQHREVVLIIEVISPTNKQIGSYPRRAYMNKQSEVLNSCTHLLEIDLLRTGEHTVAAPLHLTKWDTFPDYRVSLHRAGQLGIYESWNLRVQDRLPSISVPLTAEFPDTILDIQHAFDSVYDNGPYPRVMDYLEEPDPPLTAEQQEWADRLLRDKGFRT